jgi:hypothetical protein
MRHAYFVRLLHATDTPFVPGPPANTAALANRLDSLGPASPCEGEDSAASLPRLN